MDGEKMDAYKLLVGRPEGKRLLGRPRWRWMNDFGIDPGEVGWALVNTEMLGNS
jgi:hypothetical protein